MRGEEREGGAVSGEVVGEQLTGGLEVPFKYFGFDSE